MIWKPELEFSNTEYVDRTITDNRVVAKIRRLGNRTDIENSIVYNTFKYLGEENYIEFASPLDKCLVI